MYKSNQNCVYVYVFNREKITAYRNSLTRQMMLWFLHVHLC